MCPKASSDFGLYKEKQQERKLTPIKIILALFAAILILTVTLYLVTHLISGGSSIENSTESTLEEPAHAEKLVMTRSVKKGVFQSTPPKPFGVTYKGQPPSEFTSTTEQITTFRPNFRQKFYPNSIQDVIRHPNRFHRDFHINNPRNYRQSSTQHSNNNFTLDNDPFSQFKPHDPGDINLLATGSFRFAPPSWSNLKPRVPRVSWSRNTERQEIHNPAPLAVTLNVYPDNQKEFRGENRFNLRQLINHRIENPQSKIIKPKKMVIHLNLYGEDVGVGENKFFAEIYNRQTPIS